MPLRPPAPVARAALIAAGVVVIGAVAAVAVGLAMTRRGDGAVCPATAGWAQYQGGPQHTGAVSWSVNGSPHVVWRRPGHVSGGLAAVGGDVIAGEGGGVIDISQADGSERWSTEPRPAEGEAGPPAVGGCVVAVVAAVGSGEAGQVAGTVRLISLQTHAVLVEVPVGAISAGGLLFDGTAFAMDSGAPAGGGVRWEMLRVGVGGSAVRGPGLGGFAPAPPAQDGGLVLLAAWDGAVTALGGHGVAWRADVGGLPLTTPVVVGRRLLVGTTGGVVALDLGDGRRLWTADLVGGVAAPPVLVDGVAVVVGRDGRVRGLDVASGRWRWTADARAVAAPPVAIGDVAVVAGEDGVLTVLAPADGHGLASVHLASGVRRPMAVGDRCVFVAGADGSVTAVAMR